MKTPPWITVSFTAGQRARDAVYVAPYVKNPYDAPAKWELASVKVIRRPIVGSLVQHRLDQTDGMPNSSRVVLAVESGYTVVPIEAFESRQTGFLDVLDRDEEPDPELVSELAAEVFGKLVEQFSRPAHVAVAS